MNSAPDYDGNNTDDDIHAGMDVYQMNWYDK